MVDFFMENDAWMAKPELALKMPAVDRLPC